VAYGGKIFVTTGDRAHILKTRILMYITFFNERQSSPRVIKTTIQGTKARDNYIFKILFWPYLSYGCVEECTFLAHLTQRVLWAFAFTWSTSFVCRPYTFIKRSSSLKILGQFKPTLAWIIFRGSASTVMSDDHASQPTWPLLKVN
jgi:hypothetical protein